MSEVILNMGILSRKSDLFLAIFVVAVTGMLLISVPPGLLDLLIVLNLALSLLLLLVAVYVPDPLSLLSFPSLLLLTTLFRLSLNVASTRLILLNGYAGEVIQSFGTFLIQGEVVVGVIIFTIITIVNFVVVARGSSRIAEVAARFTLDALPGRQMAIDSDLRSGIITAEESVARREALRTESQLYGNMDGAMKFVQGDVIAGFFIICTNILGGIYVGIGNGLSFQDAIQSYTLLTVGDGLVSQIPALLISTCAGIVVTRVPSGGETTLGADLGGQLFARPGVLMFTAILLLGTGLLPGLPFQAFFVISLAFATLSYFVSRNLAATGVASGTLPILISSSGTKFISDSGRLVEGYVDDGAPRIGLDAEILYKLYNINSTHYIEVWHGLRNEFFQNVGMRLPGFHVYPDNSIDFSSFEIYLGSSKIDKGKIVLDSVLVLSAPSTAHVLGIETVGIEKHPFWDGNVFWARNTPSLKKILDAGNIPSLDFIEFIFLKLAAYCRHHPEEFLRFVEVDRLVSDAAKAYPSLVNEVIGKQIIDLPKLTELLQALVKEHVNIKGLKSILESIASYVAYRGIRSLSDDEFDLEDLVGSIRVDLRRQLVAECLSPRGTLKVIQMTDRVNAVFEESIAHSTRHEPHIMARALSLELLRGIDEAAKNIHERGVLPVSVMCDSSIRKPVINFLRNRYPAMQVLSVQELDSNIPVETVGEWDIRSIGSDGER
ncbi:MAG: FHIPEP family type III secretion protein [Bdellovibrionales bacterium]|nr:FHIPEP family type III secretion protein [Bdellovibrionales bacterium]